MALFDDQWFTGFQTAATAVGTAIVGALMAVFAVRKKISSDTADIKRTGMETGWLERLVKERDDLVQRIESLREHQLNDARQIVRLESQLSSQGESVAELSEENSRLHTLVGQAEARMAACEERVRGLAESNLANVMFSEKLVIALSKADPKAAEVIFRERWETPKIATPHPPQEGTTA